MNGLPPDCGISQLIQLLKVERERQQNSSLVNG